MVRSELVPEDDRCAGQMLGSRLELAAALVRHREVIQHCRSIRVIGAARREHDLEGPSVESLRFLITLRVVANGAEPVQGSGDLEVVGSELALERSQSRSIQPFRLLVLFRALEERCQCCSVEGERQHIPILQAFADPQPSTGGIDAALAPAFGVIGAADVVVQGRLVAFAIVGAIFTVIAFGAAWLFWRDVFAGLVRGLWRHGLWGKTVLVLLALFVLAPITPGFADAFRLAGRRLRELWRGLRFALQTRWRQEAAEMIRALPLMQEIPLEDLGDIAGRVQLREYGTGSTIVRQGEAAHAFYVIRRGTCAVAHRSPAGEVVVRRLRAGQAFGELALLEGKPRAASVRAETETQVFVLDKGTFDRLLARILPRPELDDALGRVLDVWSLRPFRELTFAEVDEIARAGEWLKAGPGEVVIRQGEPGRDFYVIGQGRVEVLRDDQVSAVLAAEEFFGETALLLDVPRTATVRSLTPVRLFRLDRSSFESLVAESLRRRQLRRPYNRPETRR